MGSGDETKLASASAGLFESHYVYVPRSSVTFDLALTPSPLKMRQAVHATKWMHQNITSAAGFGEQLNRTGMSAACDRRAADPYTIQKLLARNLQVRPAKI